MAAKKMITIPFSGPIYPKAGAYGPIETPYLEDVATILSLLNGGYPVNEVLANGTRVPLTFHNYNNHNVASAPPAEAKPAEQAPVAPVKPEADVQPDKAVQQMSKKERRRLEQEKKASQDKQDTQADGDLTIEE